MVSPEPVSPEPGVGSGSVTRLPRRATIATRVLAFILNDAGGRFTP